MAKRLLNFTSGFDIKLLGIIFALVIIGLINMYSHAGQTQFIFHIRNLTLALALVILFSQISPQRLMTFAFPLYFVGTVLLVAVLVFGTVVKGGQRWINLGVISFQPSELMKIATPLTLAWWFHRRDGAVSAVDFGIAFLLLIVPTVLIMKQPDLGTAILVFSTGFYVIYFAGLGWKLILPIILFGLVMIGIFELYSETLCANEVVWPFLHDYQKQRVCTMLFPTRDPLGKGFHIIQSMIAVGSGGTFGKGLMHGTQARLEFLPESTTDFSFAALAEESGLIGCCVIVVIFMCLVLRGLWLSQLAATPFGRLMAGAISASIFTYAFINMGMVVGILPVVGVPLPFISYGGTSIAIVGASLGMLLSIVRHRGS